MTYPFNIVVAVISLLIQSVAAQQYAKRSGDNISSANPTSGPTSFYSYTDGPSVEAVSYSWVRKWIPVTVGTVMVTVNEATNETSSTTVYHSEYVADGSSTLFSRTDTNDAGTVTAVTTDVYSNTITVTYPNTYLEPSDTMTWYAILPTFPLPLTYTFFNSSVTTFIAEGTCCSGTTVLSSAPPYPSIKQTGATVDETDSRGWIYKLEGGVELIGSSIVSSIWEPQTLEIPYKGCPYTYCPGPGTTAVSPAEPVTDQAYLLATSSTTISSAASSSASPVARSSPTKQTADPVYQTPSQSLAAISSTLPTPVVQTFAGDSSTLSQAPTGQSSKAGISLPPETPPLQTTLTLTTNQETVVTKSSLEKNTLTSLGSISATPESKSTSDKSNQILLPSSYVGVSSTGAPGIGEYIASGLGGLSPAASTSVTATLGGEGRMSTEGSVTGASRTSSSPLVLQSTSAALSMLGSGSKHVLLYLIACALAIACRM